MDYSVEVCELCDIAGCRHIRERDNKPSYVEMRLAQIASGDYKACGYTAEEVALDALKHLRGK